MPKAAGPRQYDRAPAKGADLAELQNCLAKHMLQAERLGERQARAKKCIRDIEQSGVQYGAPGRWLRDWILHELERSAHLVKKSYALSSLHTYSTTLLLAVNQLPLYTDPYEWQEDEWIHFALLLNSKCAHIHAAVRDDSDRTALGERAKHALSALALSLVRREHYIPQELMKMIGETGPQSPHGSASSTLILHKSVSQCVQSFHAIYANYPLDALQLEARAVLGHAIPMRSAEFGSLFVDFITEAGGLVIERAGYDTHKGDNAVRVAPLKEPQRTRVLELREKIKQYQGDQELLLRGNGSVEAGLRDQEHVAVFSDILKCVTGDPLARPHSLRAVALQEIAWPDWQSMAHRYLNLDVTACEISAWQVDLYSQWTRVSQGAAVAGHGDLRSALGNYLAAWALVYGIHCAGLLSALSPGPKLLNTLEIDSAALRKSRERAKSSQGSDENTSIHFDPWHWVSRHLERKVKRVDVPRSDGIDALEPTSSRLPQKMETPIARLNPACSVLYLSLRILGQHPGIALEQSTVPLSLLIELERVLPAQQLTSDATRRARSDVRPRGKAANIALAVSMLGRDLITWQLGLSADDQSSLKRVLLAEPSCIEVFGEASKATWLRLIAEFPMALCFQIQRGSRHINSDELKFVSQTRGRITLAPNPHIGVRPIVSIGLITKKNRVVSARLTSVSKAIALAISSMNNKP